MGTRLDVYLVKNGYAKSRERAKALISSGAVAVNGKTAAKCSAAIDDGDSVTLSAEDIPYVGRGALKLEKAFNEFSLDVRGLVCADIGASTGGFTQILLDRGAKKVYAVDVGHDQLDISLRFDKRVVNCEGINVRELSSEFFDEPISFMSVDLSFISLKTVIPVLAECTAQDATVAALIKPQFEAGKNAVGKNGIVRDKKVHIRILGELCMIFSGEGFSLRGLTFSPVRGGSGNIEYLAHLKKSLVEPITADIRALVDSAFDSFKE